jgi:hypothetical protein
MTGPEPAHVSDAAAGPEYKGTELTEEPTHG